MNKVKLHIYFIIFVFFFELGFTACNSKTVENKKIESVHSHVNLDFVPEVKSLILKKISLMKRLLLSKNILNEVKSSNNEFKSIKLDEILKLDKVWRSSGENSLFIVKFMNNLCALDLKEIQAKYPEFGEIFVTNRKGLNVCQTNKTSDYYQADEKWWQNVYKNKSFKGSYSGIEFDESLGRQSISIHIPIVDQGKILGIAKAVMQLDNIEKEL